MRNTAAGLLLAASALCSGVASAQSTAQVSVTEFNWVLVDLDPNDGIAASLTFLAPDPAHSSSGAVTVDAGGWASDARNGGAAFAPVAVSAASALGSAAGSISGAPGAGFSFSATAGLTGPGGPAALTNTLSTGFLSFVLSPMTAVTFNSRAVIELNQGSPGFTSANLQLNVITDVGGFPEVWNDTAVLSTDGGPRSLDRNMTLTLANVLGTANTNQLQFNSAIDAQLTSVTSAVPEPGTWAMFAGGLMLLFGHARLRKMRKARF